MIRFAVGPPFAGYSPSEQADLARAFGRLTAANLAHNFDSYGGETFKIDPDVQTRGPDKLVRTQIIPTSGPPTDLNYRMRFSGSSWKVIDVYFGAISQLTAQRSDFAATVSMGGAAGLLKTIDAQTQKLLNH
jgi:phospholipid transport system substrate-binding protein